MSGLDFVAQLEREAADAGHVTRTRALLCSLIVLVIAFARTAHADEIAPELETGDLRLAAQAELKKLVAELDPNDKKRLVGVYAAFDPNPNDPIAQVACDDDGDYVVLISDALLRLAAIVARASSFDEGGSSHKVDEYASFVARSQLPGRRLLPPPAGFFTQRPSPTYDERLTEILSFVVAGELAHLRGGDLVCAHPTATKEIGDDVWTAAEQQRAIESATRVYPGASAERDAEAITRSTKAGLSEKGALAWLRFFVQFDAERRAAISRFSPTYATHHPNAAARVSAVQRAVDAQKATSDGTTL